jgi:glutamate synthase (NADPH/NADH) large chain
MAFVYDADGSFESHVNPDSVVWRRVTMSHWEGVLKNLVSDHAAETSSVHAAALLSRWEAELPHFWQVCPKEMLNRLAHPIEAASAMAAE